MNPSNPKRGREEEDELVPPKAYPRMETDEPEGEEEELDDANGAQPQQHRLKVEDALTYLDKVKMQFGNQPQVYNQFLDIMKDFKSQSIDTPGVIQRVADLFRGFPELVFGFNTFLPPGFKIELNERGEVISQVVAVPPPASLPLPPQASFPMPVGVRPPMAGGLPPVVPAPPRDATSPVPKQPVEFNHAISYVNKIKARFASQPDVYKSFLEILHTYQREQRSIKEVYAQVQELFRHHDDLLAEFSQFLPEPDPPAEQPHPVGRPPSKKAAATKPAPAAREGAKARGPPPTQGPVISAPVPEHLPKPPKANKQRHVPDYAEAAQELPFYDKVKHAIGNQAVYENFLRCLNMYSHEIINKSELVGMVTSFLERFPDLLSQFKTFVGFQGPEEVPGQVPMTTQHHYHYEIDFSKCEKIGNSYRALPSSIGRSVVCTGRRDLDPAIAACLNDRWVSFPTLSEDTSTFLAIRKNQFEDAIFRCEDERFELDVILESNLATIRVLELELKNLQEKSPEDQAAYKFNTKTLGGRSEMIHVKSLRRLYNERTEEVLTQVSRDPLAFIPIILRRLKQKQTEWKTTQRQWNQIWRDVNEKNYLKSLDYQAPSFKRNDANNFRARVLRDKMATMRTDHRAYRKALSEGEVVAPAPPPITTVAYTDPDVIHDVSNLVLVQLQRTQFSHEEKRNIKSLVCNFLPEYLYVPSPSRPSSVVGGEKLADDQQGISLPAHEDDDPVPASSPVGPDDRVGDEDPALDEEVKESKSGNGDALAVKDPVAPRTPHDDSGAYTIRISRASAPDVASTHLFYGNNNWYVLHALHELLYTRLLEFKTLSQKYAAMDEGKGTDVPAVVLCLRPPPEVGSNRYTTFLALVHSFISGQIDLLVFEDKVRDLFSVHAYKAFTIDKLLVYFVRQVQTVVNDAPSMHLQGLYFEMQGGASSLSYKPKVLQVLDDENHVYSIEQKQPGVVTIELLDADLPTHEPSTTDKWVDYVDKYTRLDFFFPDLASSIRSPVLKRNLHAGGYMAGDHVLHGVESSNNLECKICLNTYKMFFVVKTEDYFHRNKSKNPNQSSGRRHSRFTQFLNDKVGSYPQEDILQATSWLNEGCIATERKGDSFDYKVYSSSK